MINTVPYEIIAAPFTLWVAPVGEAFPTLDVAPAGNWSKVGTSGDLNYDKSGVTVAHAQSFNKFRGLGDTGVRKVFRSEEDLTVKLKLFDLTLEQYRHALNMNPVTDTAPGSGTAGYRKLGLSRGTQVVQRALLIRGGISPYGAEFLMQYEIPIAFQTGSPEVVFKNDEPAGIDLEWTAVIDPNAANEYERYGRLIVQDAPAS